MGTALTRSSPWQGYILSLFFQVTPSFFILRRRVVLWIPRARAVDQVLACFHGLPQHAAALADTGPEDVVAEAAHGLLTAEPGDLLPPPGSRR